MRFSEVFNIKIYRDDDWFDPLLSVDTRLFLDPFLLYASEQGRFKGSHAEVIAFFNSVFKLIARSRGDHSSELWQKAVDTLLFREVDELCLGYTRAGTRGSGSGRELASVMADALWEAIKAGLEEITHFEQVAILREGIGADRISDITSNLIRYRLAAYTKDICQRHGVSLETARHLQGMYDVAQERWIPLETRLPINPYNKKHVLLVPRRYLRTLPTINADDFWDYCYTHENATIRREFGYDVTRRVPKSEIIALARRHPDLGTRYLAHVERRVPRPYDLVRDPNGLVIWYDATATYCNENQLSFLIQGESDFTTAIDQMVQAFKHFVEQNRGWNLLWNEDRRPRKPRKEEAAQDLFLGIVKHYCVANNIDISREADIGRGPVDFKTSLGFNLRALLEVKLAKNTRFWSGLGNQLPTYQRAEEIRHGYFIVIAYSEQDLRRVKDINQKVQKVNEQTGYKIKTVIVDARLHPTSASRIRRTNTMPMA